ncbi:MAG: hypothetical protein ACREJ7_08645 [Candidatus Methylomirabilales bacterium]
MYRVLLDGVPIECDSMEEAKRLARSIRNEERNGSQTKSRRSTAGRQEERRRDVLRLLKAIREAGTDGIPGKKLAQSLGLKTPKALGPIKVVMNKRLVAAGINPEQVFETSRVDGERKWIRKEKMDEAIKTLEA